MYRDVLYIYENLSLSRYLVRCAVWGGLRCCWSAGLGENQVIGEAEARRKGERREEEKGMEKRRTALLCIKSSYISSFSFVCMNIHHFSRLSPRQEMHSCLRPSVRPDTPSHPHHHLPPKLMHRHHYHHHHARRRKEGDLKRTWKHSQWHSTNLYTRCCMPTQ